MMVVIDAYSSGNLIAKELYDRNVALIHIQSSKHLPESYIRTFDQSIFLECIEYDEDYPALLNHLINRNIEHIIAGKESGVPLAEKLGTDLKVMANEPRIEKCRRNKYLMIEAIRQAQLRAARHFRSSDLKEIIEKIPECNGYPIVIKPEESGGSDGVAVCHDEQSVVTAFKNILNARNKLGFLNHAVLVEEYLEGKEYLINTVSYKGNHYITDYGFSNRETATDNGIMYDSIDMLEPRGEVYEKIKDYYFKVLDALGIINSASHGEIKVDEKGPVLIEVGARLPGINYPKLVELCTDYGPIEALADIYTHPERFIEKTKVDQYPTKLSKVVFLQSTVTGTLTHDLDFRFLENLESYETLALEVHKGDPIKETQDLFSCPGFVMLVHEDPGVLKKDHRYIREMEKNIYDRAVCINP